MNILFFILAFVGAAGFLVSIVTNIVQGTAAWPSIPQRQRRWLPLVIIVCVVLTIPYGYTLYSTSLPKSDSTSPTQSATVIQGSNATSAPTTAFPSPTPIPPTPTPSSTPTLCPKPCVVYQEGGSDGWQSWTLSSDWRIVDNKLLSNDGSNDSGSPTGAPSAIPPYSLPQGSQNFAIEVGITVPQKMQYLQYFHITACGTTTSDGWQGYSGVVVDGYKALIGTAQDELAHTNFNPNQQLNIYRLEVRGNAISLFVNGGLVVQATDNKFLPCGLQVGIASRLTVIHVSSFKVILL